MKSHVFETKNLMRPALDYGIRITDQHVQNFDIYLEELWAWNQRKNLIGLSVPQKIIIELKNKLGSLTDLNLANESQETKEAMEALQNMGYSRQEIIKVLKSAPANISTLEDKIRYGLKNIGKK